MTDNYQTARESMVRTQLIPRGISDRRVLAAMGKVPRHLFVPSHPALDAYGDYPLSIGHGQTISQPYIVALMTEALDLVGREKVLEIGTGSGYQAAVLAELADHVYTVERIAPLLTQAQNVLGELGYTNITFKAFDGTLGMPEQAPFEAIIVTAGAPRIPEPLVTQLADDGRLVIPVGDRSSQDLIKVTKKGEDLIQKDLGGCRFVSLVGVHGWKE